MQGGTVDYSGPSHGLAAEGATRARFCASALRAEASVFADHLSLVSGHLTALAGIAGDGIRQQAQAANLQLSPRDVERKIGGTSSLYSLRMSLTGLAWGCMSCGRLVGQIFQACSIASLVSLRVSCQLLLRLS